VWRDQSFRWLFDRRRFSRDQLILRCMQSAGLQVDDWTVWIDDCDIRCQLEMCGNCCFPHTHFLSFKLPLDHREHHMTMKCANRKRHFDCWHVMLHVVSVTMSHVITQCEYVAHCCCGTVDSSRSLVVSSNAAIFHQTAALKTCSLAADHFDEWEFLAHMKSSHFHSNHCTAT